MVNKIGLVIVKQFADQVRLSFISQIINIISRVLQKLVKYFNGTIMSTSFVLLATLSPVIFC